MSTENYIVPLHGVTVKPKCLTGARASLLPSPGYLGTLSLPRSTPVYIKRAIADLDSANPGDRKAGIKCLVEAEDPIAMEALAHAMKGVCSGYV